PTRRSSDLLRPRRWGSCRRDVRARAGPARHRGRRRRRGLRSGRAAGARRRRALRGRARHLDHPLDRRRVRDPVVARRARIAPPFRETPVAKSADRGPIVRIAMLQLVNVGHKSLADYATLATHGLMDEIRRLAEPLAGVRVLELSATAFGGGVAEIQYTLVPLMQDAGLEVEWRII